MKRIVYGLLATLSGVVLLFSYRTSLEAVMPVAADNTAGSTSSTTTVPAPASTSSSSADASSTTGTSTPSASPSPSTTAAQNTSGLTDGTYTGGAVRTRYGNVQVQITVSGGVITEVQVPQYPNSNREDQQINARALPVLISETTSAQSASIRTVSGATYTSQGYTQSLQSALDQAQQ